MAQDSSSSSGTKAGAASAAKIGVGTMTVMVITTIVSLRGLPSQAEFGITSIFYYVFAAIVFLIPFALVCAELASTFTKSGGLFRWVGEAFGARWGFATLYWEWQTLVIWFPTVLIFGGVALAYIWWPESFDAKLAGNKWYSIIVLLAIYWFATLLTFKRGIGSASKLSAVFGMVGTIIPGALLILLGIIYVAMGNKVELPLNTSFFPDLSNFNNVVLAASIFLFYGGLEMNAVHVQDLKNPAKDYTTSLFIAAIAIVSIFVLATLAVGVVVPEKDINLTQSLLVAYRDLWGNLGIKWMGNIMAIMLAFGVIGQVMVIIAGPSTGLLAVGKAGYLPKKLQEVNHMGVQVPILLVQGALVTLLTFVLVLLPSVQSAYQILGQLATIIYLICVITVYVAALRLRYTAPNKKRPFKIPGGNFGIWILSIIGIAGALLAGFVSFIPPSQIDTGSPAVYVGILIAGTVLFAGLPFIVEAFRKKEWKDPASTFEPFDWELEGRKPSQVSKLAAGQDPSGSTAS